MNEELVKEAVEEELPPDQAPIEGAPSFSIIVPTWGDVAGLKRTLGNIVFQSGPARQILREVLVMGDGKEEEVAALVNAANGLAKETNQNVKVWYMPTQGHSGSGNIPRRIGLKKARQDWVVFCDAGTAVTMNMFAAIAMSLKQHPQAKIVTWDMVQLIDPVPVTTTVRAVQSSDRSNGLPYVIPGCAAAVRRDCAQLVEWPDVKASDWAYFSELWEKLFGLPEDTEKAENEVVLVPWVLTVAYGNRSERKFRPPVPSYAAFQDMGYDKGFKHATTQLIEGSDYDDNANGSDPSERVEPEGSGPVSEEEAARN